MKKDKLFLLITLLILFVFPLNAKKVDVEKAETVAMRYIDSKQMGLRAGDKLTLVHTQINLPTTKSANMSGDNTDATFYVFSKGSDRGFIIISADDVAVPVLGHSDNGNFEVDNLPPNFAYWMESLSKEIAYAIENNISGTPEMQSKWNDYISGNIESTEVRASVSPLILTKWNQDSPFNDLCPYSSFTGCVATAMAQVMKFYNYPDRRTETIPSYITETKGYNVPSIGAATYNWSSMINDYSGSTNNTYKTAVATLMYHCGASIEMDYTTSGSSASSVVAGRSLYKYFKYDQSIQIKERAYYTSTEWGNLLKKELDARRPVIYDGFNSEGGHTFVCDGYNNYNEFHFNWGWGGVYDGYFVTTSLNPGSGVVAFNNDQKILINIKPDAGGTQNADMRIWNNAFTSTKTEVSKGEVFSVNAPFYNAGLFDFKGVAGIILVDGSDKIIEVISQRDMSLGSNYYFEIYNMSCMISESVSAGNYYIRAAVKQSGSSSWIMVSARLPLKVANTVITHGMKIYRTSKLSSSATAVDRGEAFTTTARFINTGSSTFTGDLGVALVDNSDRILEIIGSFVTGATLESGYYWTNEFDAACVVSTDISAGSYKIRAVAKPVGKGWSIVSGDGGVVEKLNLTVKSGTVPDKSALVLYNSTKPGFVINPNPIVQFLPLSVQFGILNNTGSTNDKPFVGDIELALCRPNGEIVEVIGSQRVIIPNDNYYYSYTFNTSNITSPKGSYLLTLFQKSSLGGEKKKVSDYSTYKNGVAVTVDGTDVFNENIVVRPLYVYAEQGTINAVSDGAEIREIKIYNLQGAEIYSSKVNDTSHKTTKSFASGVYIVHIKRDNSIESKKVIIKN